jgi:hypothetical protein
MAMRCGRNACAARSHHDHPVIALTSREKRNTRRKLLLLPLPGGRVMGSNNQMTLVEGFGSLCCAAT